jgi:hypothetical protein
MFTLTAGQLLMLALAFGFASLITAAVALLSAFDRRWGRVALTLSFAMLFGLVSVKSALAANTKLSSLSAGSAMADADLFYDVQSAGSGGVKETGTQIWTWIQTHLPAPGPIGGTTPAAGAFTTLSATGNLTTNVTGSTQCIHVNSSGVASGTGSDCGSGGGGGVTSITCPSGGAITTSGTCAVDVKTYCASGCDGVSGATWTRPSSVTLVHLFGCGGGGGGGSGAQTSATVASSGGGGGGGGDCHEVWLKAGDAGSSQTITVGGAGGAGGALSSGTTPTNGNPGTQGGNTTFGSSVCGFCTFFGGGGGQGGRDSANASIGGAGGSPWAQGASASATATTGCADGNGNGGGGASGALDHTGLCGSGGGGAATNGTANVGGYASVGAPGGGGGGGLTNADGVKSGANGSGSIGCGTAPTGGTAGNGGGSTAADFVYHPGCSGAGGGSQTGQTGAGGGGGAGTSGGGGGGGGSVCVTGGSCTANASGAGAAGGAGFLLVESF